MDRDEFGIEFPTELRDRIEIAFADHRDLDGEVERVRDARRLAQEDREIVVARSEGERRGNALGLHGRDRERVDGFEHHLAQESQRLRAVDRRARAFDILGAHHAARE